MAFGNRATVATADVEFRAETGKFEADVAVAKRIYTQSVGQMSDASLRMSVAQEKLDRAISRFGPESLQARSAAVAYRKELNALQAQANSTTRSVGHTNNELLRAGRGAIAASGAFKGLGNALFFASSSFAGAFGLIYALRSVIQAAKEAQVAQTQLRKAVKNAGVAWGENRKQILAALDAQSKLSSFDDEELKQSFSTLIIRTKDVNEALRLNAIAADVARVRQTSLQQAVTLVTRASLGQVASLRRLGLDVNRVTTAQDKLREAGVKVTFQQRQQAKASDVAATRLNVVAALQAKFAGQAAAFAQTAEGRQARFNKVLEDTKEIIGLALLPTISDLLTQFSEYLDRLNKSGDLQRKMNTLLHDGGVAAHILAEGFRTINAVVGPLVGAVGGLKTAIELALGVKLILMLRRAMAHFGLMAAASGAAKTKIVADAAAEVAALNAVSVAAGRASVAVGAGAFGSGGAGRGILGRLAGFALGPVAVTALAGFTAFKFGKARDAASHAKFLAEVKAAARKGEIPPDTMRELMGAPSWVLTDKEKQEILGLNSRSGRGQGYVDAADRAARGAAAGTGGGGRGAGGGVKRTAADIQLDLSRAQAQGNAAAEARAHRELLALYQRQAHNLERRKNLTLLQKQKLTQLYGQIEGEQSALDGIAADAARKDQERAREAEERRKAAAAKHRTQLDTREQRLENALLRAAATKQLKDDGDAARALIAFYRAATRDQDLTAKERAQYDNKRLKVRATLRQARGAAELKRLDLKEQRLRNAADRAELTETLADDRKTLRALIAFYRAEVQNEELSAKARADAEKKRVAARKRLKDIGKQGGAGGGETGGGFTMADFRRQSFDFLQSLHGVTNTYGSNIDQSGGAAGWALHSQGSLQLSELGKQTSAMLTVARRLGHQDARYIGASADVVMDGVGGI